MRNVTVMLLKLIRFSMHWPLCMSRERMHKYTVCMQNVRSFSIKANHYSHYTWCYRTKWLQHSFPFHSGDAPHFHPPKPKCVRMRMCEFVQVSAPSTNRALTCEITNSSWILFFGVQLHSDAMHSGCFFYKIPNTFTHTHTHHTLFCIGVGDETEECIGSVGV